VEKEDLSNGCQNLKRKFGANHAFSEIIERNFGRKYHTFCVFKSFLELPLLLRLSQKNAWLPTFFNRQR